MTTHPSGPPAVSVLMPVLLRDGGPEPLALLRRALESIHDQRFPGAMEILLVDDGSPVPVAERLPALGAAGAGVRILRRPANQGITHALNAGLTAARHPYVARLDADDAWRAGKIEAQFARLAADPDLTLVGTSMRALRLDGSVVAEHVRPDGWAHILAFCVDVGCPFPHGSVVARRDIYLALGGYPHAAGFAHCEDFALWSLWLRFFKPSVVSDALYDHTLSERSISSRHGAQQAEASRRLRDDLARLDLAKVVPGAMVALAEALGVSLVDAGLLALRMWRHGVGAAKLPEGAVGPLRALLPDRDLG